MSNARSYQLTPERDVAQIDVSLHCYRTVREFRVVYERPDECFAVLDHKSVQMMVQEAAGPGRRLRTAPLEHPYGRGINVQIQIADVHATLRPGVCGGMHDHYSPGNAVVSH